MLSKVFVICALFVAAHASLLGVGIVNTGISNSARQQDAHGNYAFGYDIVDGKGASNSRSEVGDGVGNKKGSYSLTDIDGRKRIVEYVADGHGFRAAVKTNEPGTAMSAPAAAVIVSPYAAPVAPVAHGGIVAGPMLAQVAPVSAYSTTIGHGAVVRAPIGVLGKGIGLGGIGLGGIGLGGVGLGGIGLGGLGLGGLGLGHGALVGAPIGVLGKGW